MEKLDEDSAAKFINALIKSVQTLCHGYLEFDNGIEIIGHLNLSIDKGSSLHYILEEKVCKNEENSTLFISNSFHAQNQKSDSKSKGKDSDAQLGSRSEERTNSSDLGETDKLSAISSISSALSKSHEKPRSASTSSSKESENLHSKPLSSTAKRKASDDHSNDVRTAKQSHLSSSPSPVSHFLSQSPHDPSGSSSPVDTKPSLRHLQGEDSGGTVLPQTAVVGSDSASDLGVNLVGSVLERVDDQSNPDLPDRGEDSDGDLEVTFIKEEYVEGEQSACQFENSGGQQYGRGTHQRASSSDMSDGSMYPVSLHHSQSASSTFIPSAHDMTAAQHYGPSTSSQPQPGTSGVRGDIKSILIHQARSSASEFMVHQDRKKQEINIERQNKWALSHFRGSQGHNLSTVGPFTFHHQQSPPVKYQSQAHQGMPRAWAFHGTIPQHAVISPDQKLPQTPQSHGQQSQHCSQQSNSGPYSYISGLETVHADSDMDKSSTSCLFKCKWCGAEFRTPHGFKGHVRKNHSNNPNFRCKLCGKGFLMKGHYEGHMNMHNNVKTFECPKCPRRFAYKSSLNAHVKSCGWRDFQMEKLWEDGQNT